MQRKTEEELANIINRASESVAASNGKEIQAEDEEEEMVNVRLSFNITRQSLIHIDLHRRSLIKRRGRGTGRGERSRRGLGIGR